VLLAAALSSSVAVVNPVANAAIVTYDWVNLGGDEPGPVASFTLTAADYQSAIATGAYVPINTLTASYAYPSFSPHAFSIEDVPIDLGPVVVFLDSSGGVTGFLSLRGGYGYPHPPWGAFMVSKDEGQYRYSMLWVDSGSGWRASVEDAPRTGQVNWFGNGIWERDVAPVPKPSTVIAGALLLLPFGAGVVRSLRRRR
jgi:hypothetical protein